MSINTPDQQITIPQGTDLADVVAMIANMIADVETRLNLRYADMADRIARHPVGIEGEYSDLASEGWSDAYDGTNWISAAARGHRGMKFRTADAVGITTNIVPANDAVLFVPLEATGDFLFGADLFYDTPTTADMRVAFTWPGAPTQSRWGIMGRDPTTNTNITAPVATASGTALQVGGMGAGTPTWAKVFGYIRNTGVAGNLQLQYAQGTSDAGALTVRAGSRLWVLRAG